MLGHSIESEIFRAASDHMLFYTYSFLLFQINHAGLLYLSWMLCRSSVIRISHNVL